MLQSSIATWLTKKSTPGTAVGSQSSSQTSLPPAVQTSSQPAANNTSQGQKSDESGEQSSTASRALSKAKLLPNVGIAPVTKDNISQFRRLVTVLLPATYTDKFYAETLTDPVISSVSLLALWKDEAGQDGKVVAGIRCRVFVSSPAELPKRKKRYPRRAEASTSLPLARWRPSVIMDWQRYFYARSCGELSKTTASQRLRLMSGRRTKKQGLGTPNSVFRRPNTKPITIENCGRPVPGCFNGEFCPLIS